MDFIVVFMILLIFVLVLQLPRQYERIITLERKNKQTGLPPRRLTHRKRRRRKH